MPNVSLGDHFDRFISEKLAEGRYQNASEVVRAGLRLLEDQELSRAERAAQLKAEINRAFDEGGESIPAEDVFARLEATFAAEHKVAAGGA